MSFRLASVTVKRPAIRSPRPWISAGTSASQLATFTTSSVRPWSRPKPSRSSRSRPRPGWSVRNSLSGSRTTPRTRRVPRALISARSSAAAWPATRAAIPRIAMRDAPALEITAWAPLRSERRHAHHVEATVHVQHLPRDAAGERGDEEERGIPHLLLLRVLAQGRVRAVVLEHLRDPVHA